MLIKKLRVIHGSEVGNPVFPPLDTGRSPHRTENGRQKTPYAFKTVLCETLLRTSKRGIEVLFQKPS